MLDQQEVLSELRASISHEWASGFEQLHRIPSTNVRKFVDYIARLEPPGKEAFLAALAEHASDFLNPQPHQPSLYKRNNAYRSYVDAVRDMRGERYSSVRALRAPSVVAEAEARVASDHNPPRRARMAYAKPRPVASAAKLMRIRSLKPVTSADIRKQVKQALSKLMSFFSVTHEPAHFWEYTGEVQSVPVVVSINYASPIYTQLEYWVSIRGERTGLSGSNYERLMGLTSADWDLLEEANLEQSVLVLCDHIAYCAAFLSRLPASVGRQRHTEDA
jgi:hypothetical protein